LLVLFGVASGQARPFGEVDVTLESEPRGNATHGYSELWVRIVNKSETDHTVGLTFPKSNYSPGVDHLRAVTRRVTVEAGKTVRVPIAWPERITVSGSGVGVTVDGRDFDETLSINRSYRGYSYGSTGSGPQPLVLYSRTVNTQFPDWIHNGRFKGMLAAPTMTTNDIIRADLTADLWSPNWLGYSRYDGVVVTADDLRIMPAEVRNAIGQYVEAGGSLLVLGPKPNLPGLWSVRQTNRLLPGLAQVGFGECMVTDDSDISWWNADAYSMLFDMWKRSTAPWQREKPPAEANRAFPVVDDGISVPVRPLMALMFLFAIAIGPVNLLLLARYKRRLWLFWTVPVVSFFTCMLVILWMAVTEGWQGQARIEGLTILDERSRRASSVGWVGFYSPLMPRGGLHFSTDTEASFQNGEEMYSYGYRRRSSSAAAVSIDWSNDQHFASGWLTPRVPAHFVIRKSELRRERVTIARTPDGGIEAVNGLGANITGFWYCDEAGKLYRTENIAAGERAKLQPTGKPTGNLKGLRDLYTMDWPTIVSRAKSEAPAILLPRSYFAILNGAPFLDDPMPRVSNRRTQSAVIGLVKEGE
jgi:hypothetical protein